MLIDPSTFSRELDQLLEPKSQDIAVWESSVFDQLVPDPDTPLILYGAGGLGRRTLRGLQRLGRPPVAFADGNPALAGRHIEGVPVLSRAEAVAVWGQEAVFLVCIWGAHPQDTLQARKESLTQEGCRQVISFLSLYWKYPELFLPHYSCGLPSTAYRHKPQIRQLATLLQDAESQAELMRQLRWRTQLDAAPEFLTKDRPYFPLSLFHLLPDEFFVDCGAFNGDTLADFLAVADSDFSAYWGLEPDPINFAQLEKTVEALPAAQCEKIRLFPLAASAQKETLAFDSGQGAASCPSADGNVRIEAEALDHLLEGQRPTYLKMDIEGGEPAALEGARNLLIRHRPIVAVSIYHLPSHLWEIPLLLRPWLDDYAWFLRAHDREGWDLVLYAVPQKRCLSFMKG
jgi:FkbM family methyltransferase